MADYYKLVSTTNRHTDWTAEVVLEVDDTGEPTKVVSATRPAQLSAENRKKVESLGYGLESVSKEEADEAERIALAGGDVVGGAPLFGGSEQPNQSGATSADVDQD